jgi:CubicO group peptidase (beta-lactamase class C family)
MKGRDTMPASGIFTPRLQRITDMLHTYLDNNKLAGMNALVSYRGQVAYKTCLGMMDLEANKPVQFDTIFRIASMTKPITSIAAMLLYEQGASISTRPSASLSRPCRMLRSLLVKLAMDQHWKN